MSSELLMQEYLRRCAQEKGETKGLKRDRDWEENSQSENDEYSSEEEEEEDNSNEYTMASRSPGRIQYQRQAYYGNSAGQTQNNMQNQYP